MSERTFMERPDGLDHPIVPKIMRRMSKFNVWLYQKTGGRLGNKWRVGSAFPWGAPVALLTSIGRKSGEPRTAPLIFGLDGENVVVVASQGGMPKHPLWYRNLQKTPQVEIQIGNKKRPYVARTVEGAEREHLWAFMCEIYADYEQYEYWTEREIPVVICEPLA